MAYSSAHAGRRAVGHEPDEAGQKLAGNRAVEHAVRESLLAAEKPQCQLDERGGDQQEGEYLGGVDKRRAEYALVFAAAAAAARAQLRDVGRRPAPADAVEEGVHAEARHEREENLEDD